LQDLQIILFYKLVAKLPETRNKFTFQSYAKIVPCLDSSKNNKTFSPKGRNFQILFKKKSYQPLLKGAGSAINILVITAGLLIRGIPNPETV
jgi:hypothetical protein